MAHLPSIRTAGWTSLAVAATLLTAGSAAAAPEKLFYSGFEEGFPGEFTDYDNGTLTDKDVPNPGKVAAWSLVGEDKFPDILAGDTVYKGWITDNADASHRAYPVLHCDYPTPLVNSFWVWLDVDYNKLDPQTDWVHVGTWGNDPIWTVHTMSVLNRKLHMAHLQNYKYTGPMPQPDFPLKQWVRITVYLHYPQNGDGTVCAWQDGVPVMTGKWTKVDGPNLMRTHWGMYAAGSVDHGVQYNDEIQIWGIDAPLADCNGPEPVSPYPQPNEGGETTGGETTGDESSGGDTEALTTGNTTTGDPETSGPQTTTAETGDPTTTTDPGTGGGQGSTGSGDTPTTDGPGDTTPDATTSGGATTNDATGSTTGDPGVSQEDGCGCTTTPSSDLGWLGLGLLAALRRRRRA